MYPWQTAPFLFRDVAIGTIKKIEKNIATTPAMIINSNIIDIKTDLFKLQKQAQTIICRFKLHMEI